ncbi:hypothetical protein BCR34DRAFT_578798 [Clohesyomyces aquaticus]|uniref:Uncharacterized protein n=1 Tax=Clohesyomyces aquaticus TaxID=1231657 RepID=A0A1Y1YE15_9PLEO|nr:hypothetical protein BCR34DRAFT_578798 [Clohesyomyces aquaticus]
MDHWGDPWADDSHTKSPQRETVATPPPLPAAPVLLNGFLDDAQWGIAEQDEGFGDWAAYPAPSNRIPPAALEARAADASPLTKPTELRDDIGAIGLGDEGWGSFAEERESPPGSDKVVSEASDSATTIQPDDVASRPSHELPSAPKHDDGLSTRPSTSPSDASLTEAPTESPRTSFEDERAARHVETGRATSILRHDEKPLVGAVAATPELEYLSKEGSEGGFGEDGADEHEHDHDEQNRKDHGPLSGENVPYVQPRKSHDRISAEPENVFLREPPAGHAVETRLIAVPGINLFHVSQLFLSSSRPFKSSECPDDPIFTTSARKAWYRLTRKQTMREFNSGNDDDNYVRVNWATSHIRSDVIKIVGRWQSEDRTSGRGHGGGAGFNWDHRAAPDAQALNLHVRKNSSISTGSQIRPVKQAVSPLSTTAAPASFSWSSSPVPLDGPGLRATSSPLAIKQKPVNVSQQPELRAPSLDFTVSESRQLKQGSFPLSETATDVSKPPPVSGQISHESGPLISSLKEESRVEGPRNTLQQTRPFIGADSRQTLERLDTHPESLPTATEDDDDEWGEMVESPAVSAPPALAALAPSSTHTDSSSKSITTPSKPSRTSPLQPPQSRHASPIVRLKTVVSPTSARFGFNGLIPPNTEVGPIGPGILKPVAKSTHPTTAKSRVGSGALSDMDEFARRVSSPPVLESEEADDFSDFASSVLHPGVTQTEDDRVSIPLDVDARISDDFAAFESSVPIVPSTSFQSATKIADENPPTNSPTTPPPSSTSISAPDPLFDADFSIFESSLPTSNPPTAQRSLDPSDPFSIFEHTPPVSVTATPPPPAVPFTRPSPQPATPPPKLPLTGASNSALRRKAEEDEMLRGIVSGLPDLGYMLRR